MSKKKKKNDHQAKANPLDNKQQLNSNGNSFHKLLQTIFTQEIGKTQFKFLVGLSLLIVLLEFCAFAFKGVFSIVASRLWMLGWIFCIIGIIYMFVRLVIHDLKAKHYLSLVFIAGVFTVLILAIGNFDKIVIGQDATQQLAAGTLSFSVPDWNYTGKAFLDYPNRQYVLAAIPTLIFGRSIPALQIGFAYPFFLSLLLIYTGFREWQKKEGISQVFAMVAVSALFTFPYVTEYYIYFEHTLFPACFTMQCIGWLLLFLKKPTLLHALAMMWTCAMMANCYTPAIASVALFVCIIFLLGFFTLSKKHILPYPRLEGRLSFLTCVNMSAVITLFAAFTFLFGRGDRVTDMRTEIFMESLAATKEGYSIFFLNSPSVFSNYLLIFIVVYLLMSLLYRFGFIHFVISVWVLGIVGMSQFLKGYAIYEPSISMSRTLITVPVLVTAMYLTGLEAIKRYKIKAKPLLLTLVVIINMGFGIYNIYKPVVQGDAAKYFNPDTLQPMKYVINEMVLTVKEAEREGNDSLTLVLYTNNIWLKNLNDYTSYFLPVTKVYALSEGEPLPSPVENMVIYCDDNIAYLPADNYLLFDEDLQFSLGKNRTFGLTRYLVSNDPVY
ncbi:MAG: hypothetical protein KBA53_06660 [Thermoclostridium sp.]|nr:hypothetical protein [Thermoclostridium sp.]